MTDLTDQRGSLHAHRMPQVGDPNMGKSTAMNSIFGKKVVSSSRTPGHTKHIQTHFLLPSVCFCDSPGIVTPKVDLPKSLQAVFGSYPIAQLREPYSAIRNIAECASPSIQALYRLERELPSVTIDHFRV